MPATFDSFPFNKRVVHEDSWREMAETWRTSGIIVQGVVMDASDGDCAVSPSAGMEVKIATGKAWVKGHMWTHIDDYEYLTINPNTSGSSRADLVVLRLYISDTARPDRMEYLVLEGATTPEQNANVWDLPLARVSVADGATSISAANITDLRVTSNQFGYTPAAQLTYGSLLAVGASTTETNTWSIERFNNMGMFDASQPDRITIKEPGIYLVQAMVYWRRTGAGLISGQMEMSIYQNSGGTLRQFVRDSRYLSLSNGVQSVSQVVSCNTGDYLYTRVTNTTSNTDVVIDAAQPYSPYFSAIKLGTVAGL